MSKIENVFHKSKSERLLKILDDITKDENANVFMDDTVFDRITMLSELDDLEFSQKNFYCNLKLITNKNKIDNQRYRYWKTKEGIINDFKSAFFEEHLNLLSTLEKILLNIEEKDIDFAAELINYVSSQKNH